jgi:DNA-binding LacI/PurR family transcriptional regulator
MLGIEPFYAEFIAGMDDRLAPHNGSVLLQVVPTLERELESYERWASSGQVSAVVLGDLIEHDVRPGFLHELGIPTLVLGEPELPPGISAIRVDNYAAMSEAVARLVALGHTRIGRVSGPSGLFHTRQRTLAFESATAEAGIVGATAVGDYTEEGGEVATRQLLSAPQPPTCIIYDNDIMAVAGLGVAYGLGIAVPGALSILAWDDSTLCRLAVPPLSAMNSDVHALGELAASTILDLLAGGPASTIEAPPPRFISRGSVSAPALV